jgi:hypothetical protein
VWPRREPLRVAIGLLRSDEPLITAAGPTSAHRHQGVDRRNDRRWHERRQCEIQLPLDFGETRSSLLRLLVARTGGPDPLQPDNGPTCSPDSRRSQVPSISATALRRVKNFRARHQPVVLKSSAGAQGLRPYARASRAVACGATAAVEDAGISTGSRSSHQGGRSTASVNVRSGAATPAKGAQRPGSRSDRPGTL